jgi:hypothetical protein
MPEGSVYPQFIHDAALPGLCLLLQVHGRERRPSKNIRHILGTPKKTRGYPR